VSYHPAVLGIARPRRQDAGGPGSERRDTMVATHETWREGIAGPSGEDHEQHPEGQVLAALRSAAAREHARLRVVLGEPGAGKSRLLEEWLRRWAADLGEPRLGLPIPVLVRLRALRPEDLGLDRDGLADLLWERGCDERGLLSEPRDGFYRAGAARLFRPVWLLDGLDEVPPALLGPDLPRALAALPGLKLATCRTAVFRSLREAFAPYQEPRSEYEILPLAPAEWRAFLTARLRDPARAAVLVALIKGNAQLVASAEVVENPARSGV
jgi:predicted NACHT family NTPase